MVFIAFFLKRPMLLVGIVLAIGVLLFASGCGKKSQLETPGDYEGLPPPEERPSTNY